MQARRFNFEACRDCTDQWNRQNSTTPCLRVVTLGSQGLTAIPMGKVGGGRGNSCPCVISWPEVQTYANGGAGVIRMSTEAEGLIKILRARMSVDKTRRWVTQPEYVGYMDKLGFNGNFAGYFVSGGPDTPPQLAGQWHFVRRLADDELQQLRQFRLENALDVDFTNWQMKFECAIWKGLLRAPSKGAVQVAGMGTWPNLTILAASLALMFTPVGGVIGITKVVCGIIGFGAMAMQWGAMIEEFGAKVFSARRPQDLDAAADIFADLIAQICIAGVIAVLFAGVEKWRSAANQAKTQVGPNAEQPPGQIRKVPLDGDTPDRQPNGPGGASRKVALDGGVMPLKEFAQFPNFTYQFIEGFRRYLSQQQFDLRAMRTSPVFGPDGKPLMMPVQGPDGGPLIGADGKPVMKYVGDWKSEIWVRIQPGKVRAECVRIDSEGHLPVLNPAWRDGPLVPTPKFSDNYKPGQFEHASPSEVPHYHLETIPLDQLERYLKENVVFADAEKFTVSGKDIVEMQKQLQAARNWFVDRYGANKYQFEMAKPVTGIQQGHIPLARRTPNPRLVVNSPFRKP